MRFTQFIFQNKIPHLFYLVRFRLARFRLNVDYIQNIFPMENMMIAFNPLAKTKSPQQGTHLVKAYIRVASAG